mmetsp:Transcript_49272/g.96388  ORF Transcript_49272/g.96388 Transcript_49272/m.96388 type:complete len:404 (+) Transcript_49272:64-1275(+)
MPSPEVLKLFIKMITLGNIGLTSSLFHPSTTSSITKRIDTTREAIASRRDFFHLMILPPLIFLPTISSAFDELKRSNYIYSSIWTGTNLKKMSSKEAAAVARRSPDQTFSFAKWPDPILRQIASPIPSHFPDENLKEIAYALRRTARKYGAVGLAAQQCGVDASIIFLEKAGGPSSVFRLDRDTPSKIENSGIFLVNPKIISRSPEIEMKVWTEECLVLPPYFTAAVLRDNAVSVEYETLDRKKLVIKLEGELARALQHEMDHDRGILILDHIGFEDMENDDMRALEEKGHNQRMELAYSRYLNTRSSREGEKDSKRINILQDIVFPRPANAADSDQKITQQVECDKECLARRKVIIEERRAMMMQSRSTTRRQDMFELSRQRAMLYNTTYNGMDCVPGIPCL